MKARNYTPGRMAPVRLVVLHTMEAAEKPGTASAVARWFAGPNAPQASAHYCVDAAETVQCVDEGDTAWAAPGANHDGIQIEMAGYAGQGAAGWADEYSQAMLRRVADLVRGVCERHRLPVQALDAKDLLAGGSGITTHHAVSLAYKKSTHNDPGKDFPMGDFLSMVRGVPEPYNPTIPQTGSDRGSLLVAQPEWLSIAQGVKMTADALKWSAAIGGWIGRRIVANPQEAAKLAIAFNAYLPTPELLDIAYEQAQWLFPVPLPGCPTTREAAERHSYLIDEQIEEIEEIEGRALRLLAPTGKQWIAPHKARPANRAGEYGWHVPETTRATWRGIPLHGPHSGQYKVIQPEWYGHGLTHCDYSRFVRLVRCTDEALAHYYKGRKLRPYL